MCEKLVFDSLIGERAGRVEAERTKVTREHFHRRDAAGLDRLDELGPRRERKVLAAPEAEALGVGEVVDGGRACRRDVDDAGARQGVLEPQARAALLRGGLVATLALAAGCVLHGVALVEDDHSIRSEEHTSELQSLMRNSYAVFCLKKKKQTKQ